MGAGDLGIENTEVDKNAAGDKVLTDSRESS